MGIARKLGNFKRQEQSKSAAYKLSKALQEFYAVNPVSKWQRDRVSEIRALFEHKKKALEIAHDIAASELAEMFMQHELDYLYASKQFKEDNPGQEWTPSGIRGVMKKAFWTNLVKKGMALGLSFKAPITNGDQVEAK